MYSHTNRNFHFNQVVYGKVSSKLPQQNLIANYVMQNGELVDKVGGAGQELLFPCFKGDGSSKTLNMMENYSFSAGFSVSFRAKIKSKTTNNRYITKGVGTSGTWMISMGAISDNAIRIYARDNNNNTKDWTSSLTSTIGTEELITVVFNLTLNKIQLYKNTTLVDSGIIGSSWDSGFSNATKNLFVGSLGTAGWLDGSISDLRIYDSELTSADVTELVAKTSTKEIDYYFPLTGHAYGFKADGTVITGVSSDATCFEGLTTYNPEEGYNLGLKCISTGSSHIVSAKTSGEWEFGFIKSPVSGYIDFNLVSNTTTGVAGTGFTGLVLRMGTGVYCQVRINGNYQQYDSFYTATGYLEANKRYYVKVTVTEGKVVTMQMKGEGKIGDEYPTGSLEYVDVVPSNGTNPATVSSTAIDTSSYFVLSATTGDAIAFTKTDDDSIKLSTLENEIYKPIIIPQSRETGKDNEDINGVELVEFLGGNAMPPYAIYNANSITGTNASAIKSIMDRNSGTITDSDNQKFGFHGTNSPEKYYWNISTLLRLPEFLKSLQTNWHLFMKVREDDKAIEQLVIYSATPSAIDEAQRLKILKATKDTTTKVQDYEAYISCGELSTTGLKTGSAMIKNGGAEATIDAGVERVHSVSSQHEFIQTDTNIQPTLQKDSRDNFYLLFGVDDELLVYFDDVSASLPASNHFYAKNESLNWVKIPLANRNKIQYSDLAGVSYKVYGFISVLAGSEEEQEITGGGDTWHLTENSELNSNTILVSP